MNIEEKAKLFAVNAHNKQIRKSDKDKPMIIHPIDVANKIKEYGFDSNVIAAGYLHDVIEDTKYTKDDILKEFNEDILSLVLADTESDKTKSWEERKKETINKIKDLDLRHKAIITCDKISNLEDMMILFELNGKQDFSAFKRGFDKQKWYYESVYKCLIENEDENIEMFKRLKYLLDYIFYNKKEDEYLKEYIFNNKINDYNKLLKLNFKNKEIKKLHSVLKNKKPYVIEFTGTPRTGKTTLINNLYDFFKKEGFKVSIIEEFTSSKRYKNEIYPKLKDKSKKELNYEIPKYVNEQLEKELIKDIDIIIIDRSLFDRLIWIDRLYLKDGITNDEYNEFINTYKLIIKENINTIIATYTDCNTSLKRDYKHHLSLGKRKFLNEDNINEYNKSLLNMNKLNDINIKLFDTTNKSEKKVAIDVANKILDDIRKTYINELKREYWK